jgi:predicted Fe-Mo cluster-binding NifX family protein
MIVFLPVDEKDRNCSVSSFFCKAKFFLLADFEKDTFEIIENKFLNETNNRAEQVANFAISKAKAVIIKNIGNRGFNLFSKANIKIFKVGDIKAIDAVKLLKENKLNKLQAPLNNCSCKH